MLARYLLLSSVRLSVCLNLAISKDKCTSLWNFAPIGGLNFAAASRLCCQQNSSTVELVDDTLTVDSSCCLLRVAQLWLYYFDLLWICCIKAKFHYTGPTGPDRTRATRTDFVGDPHGPNGLSRRPGPQKSPCGSGRARVVEFSYNLFLRAAVDKISIDIDIERRAVRLRQQSFMQYQIVVLWSVLT